MLIIIFIISFLKYIMCSDINKYENVNAIIGGNIISFNNGIYNNYFYRCLLKYNNGQYIYIKNYDLSTLDGTCPTIINNKTCLIDIWKEEIKI